MYFASRSLAPDNTLGRNLDQDFGAGVTAGKLLSACMGLINVVVPTYVVPAILGCLTSDLRLASQLSMTGGLVFVVLVPLTVTLVLDSQCGSKWLLLWNSCANNPTAFDISLDVAPLGESSLSRMTVWLSVDLLRGRGCQAVASRCHSK